VAGRVVSGPLLRARRTAGAIKRRLFETPERASWRRACRAVWTSDGDVTVHCEGADSGAVASLAGETDGQAIQVRATRLAGWPEAEPIDLLKLDIEGVAVAGLQGCRPLLSNVQALLFEVHEFDTRQRQSPGLRQLPESAGFAYAVTHVTRLPSRQPRGSQSTPFPHRSSVWVEAVSAWKAGTR
jgi:FkbM family methyltransferase